MARPLLAIATMGARRIVLLGLALAMAATAPRLRADTEVEVAGYGGTSPGAWACGPLGRANYGGVAARVRVAAHEEQSSKWVAEVGAASEYEDIEILDCRETSECEAGESGPEDRVLGGAHARVGYHAEKVGLEGGVSAFQGWESFSSERPVIALFPDVELTVGREAYGRGIFGIGTPLVTQYRRPGAYAGCEFPVSSAKLRLQGGIFRAGPQVGNAAARADGVALLPMSETASVRLGAAASYAEDEGVGAEGSIGLQYAP